MCANINISRAPFTYAAWKSPELIEKISQVAGIDLIPSIDYEIANINVSINNQTVSVIDNNKSCDDDLPAFAWHYDSFPFVCVVMLSDCTDMIGGETALRTPSGEVLTVRGPACVSFLYKKQAPISKLFTDVIISGNCCCHAGKIH